MTPGGSEADLGSMAIEIEEDDSRTFCCSKCGEDVALTKLSKASRNQQKSKRALVEEACMAAYKTLTRRWKTNKKLKAWWDNKTAVQQKAWYGEQKRLNQDRQSGDSVRLSVESELGRRILRLSGSS